MVHLDSLGMGAVEEFETVAALALRRDPARPLGSELREVLLDRVGVHAPQEDREARETAPALAPEGRIVHHPRPRPRVGLGARGGGRVGTATQTGWRRPSPVRLAILVAASLAAVLAGCLTTLAMLSRSTPSSKREAVASAVAVATVPVPTPAPRPGRDHPDADG